MRPERVYLRLGMANLSPVRLNSRPNLRLGRVNLRPERANFRPHLPELRPKRVNFEAWEGQSVA